MKQRFLIILFIFLAALLSGCKENMPLEDLTITLILGIDLDDENNLIISESSPVFNQDAKKNVEAYQLKEKTIRRSREAFDTLSTGEVTAGKIQVLLIGKRILEHEDWFPILDTVYRNPNFSVNTKVIAIDGPVSDVILYEPPDKPQLALYLKEIIEKNTENARTALSTLQVLHRQMYEKGITPSLSEIKKGKDLQLTGTTLLDKKGKYIDTLNIEDSSLLLILQNEQEQNLTFSFPLTSLEEKGGLFHKNEISMVASQIKVKVKTNYKQDQFHFDYKIKMTGNIVESLISLNGIKDAELKKAIEKEMNSRFENLIKKIQDEKIDPIGLGLYARAHHYKQYKEVEENWGEAFAESNIDVSVDIDIKSTGSIK